MNQTPVTGPVLNGPDIFSFGNLQWHEEIAKHVIALGGHLIGLRHRHNNIRMPEMPAFGKFWRLGQVLAVSLGHARTYPILDQRNLVICQAAGSNEFAITRDWFPRWHDPFSYDLGNQL